MNVYTWEMKRNIKTTIVWMVALVLVQLMYISVYPSMVKDTELLTRMMKLMPKAFLRIFGLEDLDFSNILNYQASISSIYVTLVGSIFAVLLTCKVLAKEESEKTAEFLLSKPVKRSNVLLQKISSTLTLILTFDLVICLSSLLMVEFFKQGAVDYTRFWLFWLSQILLHLTVSNLVFAVIVLAKRQDSTTSFSIGMTFVLYILAMASKLTEKLELLKYLTPFYYSEGIRIVKYGRMEPVFLVIYFFLNLALVLSSLFFYSKKDIYL
ncbi:MAG: ABC transporter permease subunit [Pseudothermotoga sp.]|uniref:ABC transporter permease subunit n=1 Tax=Pseudothermotoga sp. TaxID=2033661 RepID=UPI002586129F|nr:ABC transporter permease subunit [Pseudothermotoga sp.]MDI6863814.1 ABC transporter permease subunit [Pseudothermotoga sp.]